MIQGASMIIMIQIYDSWAGADTLFNAFQRDILRPRNLALRLVYVPEYKDRYRF